MVAELIITTPDGGSRAVRLDGPRYALGRASGIELSLPEDAGLSRQHLALELHEGAWTVADLGSKNGTLLNGVPLTSRQPLNPGDVIEASFTRLVFGESVAVPSQPADRTLTFDPATSPSPTVQEGPPLAGLPSGVHWWDSPAATLLHATRELMTQQRPNALYSRVFQLAGELVGGADGVLLVRDGDDLIVRAAQGSGFHIPEGVRDAVFFRGVGLLETAEPGYLAVPLQIGQRVVGMLYFQQANAGFTMDQVRLLTALGNVAAVFAEQLQNAETSAALRIVRAELQQAEAVKQRLLPTTLPMLPGFEVSLHHQPCQAVAGDYFQFLTRHAGRTGILLSDIAGRGLPVALVLAGLHARVDVLAETMEDPGQFLTKLNRMVSSIRTDNRLLTTFSCVVDTMSGVVNYSNGGHQPGILVREGGQVEQLRRGGMALGAMSRMHYDSAQVYLHTGDTILIYSDGVVECGNTKGEEFGVDRLTEALVAAREQPVKELQETLSQALNTWSQAAPIEDDRTFIILKKAEC